MNDSTDDVRVGDRLATGHDHDFEGVLARPWRIRIARQRDVDSIARRGHARRRGWTAGVVLRPSAAAAGREKLAVTMSGTATMSAFIWRLLMRELFRHDGELPAAEALSAPAHIDRDIPAAGHHHLA